MLRCPFCSWAGGSDAVAQAYPVKPVRIIVPLAAGGLADILARVVAQRLGEVSGQSFVVENRTGAAGAVGGEAAARAPGDGYTLFLGGQGINAVLPHLTRLTFDPAMDFVAVIHLATFPNLLVVNPWSAERRELVDHAKANPGKVSYASQGNGSSGHMVAEQFKLLTGVDMVHVPYRGAAPAVQDLVAGHVQIMFDSVTLQMPHPHGWGDAPAGGADAAGQRAARRADDGRGRLCRDAGRHVVRPVRSGRHTAPVIDWVNGEARKAFAPPEVRQRFVSQGATLPLGTPEEFAAHTIAERVKWGDVIRRANIRLE